MVALCGLSKKVLAGGIHWIFENALLWKEHIQVMEKRVFVFISITGFGKGQ